jgi:hypothetical protein
MYVWLLTAAESMAISVAEAVNDRVPVLGEPPLSMFIENGTVIRVPRVPRVALL